jgi:hypothetical protein
MDHLKILQLQDLRKALGIFALHYGQLWLDFRYPGEKVGYVDVTLKEKANIRMKGIYSPSHRVNSLETFGIIDAIDSKMLTNIRRSWISFAGSKLLNEKLTVSAADYDIAAMDWACKVLKPYFPSRSEWTRTKIKVIFTATAVNTFEKEVDSMSPELASQLVLESFKKSEYFYPKRTTHDKDSAKVIETRQEIYPYPEDLFQ